MIMGLIFALIYQRLEIACCVFFDNISGFTQVLFLQHVILCF